MIKTTSLFLGCFLGTFAFHISVANSQPNSIPKGYKNPKADSLLRKAELQQLAHNFKGQIETFKHILRVLPNDPGAMNSVAGLSGQLGNFKKEIKWAQKTIKAHPTFYQAYINYGNGLAQIGKLKKATSIFKKAIHLDASKPEGFYNLGLLTKMKFKYKLAIKYYKKSVVVDPQFANGYFNLASIYANVGKFDKATDALHKVLKLQPNAQDAKKMLHKINQIKRNDYK